MTAIDLGLPGFSEGHRGGSMMLFCVILFLTLGFSLPAVGEPPPALLWVRQGGGLGDAEAHAVAVDTAGNVYVTGSFSGSNVLGNTTLISSGYDDIFVAKYDKGGQVVWAQKAGGASYDHGLGIAVDNTGNTFVVGIFQGTAYFGSTNMTSRGQSDLFVAKYNPAGNLLWVRKAGGNDFDEAHGIALDAGGDLYLTGSFDATATFGTITLINTSLSSDIFVAKCSSAGTFLWARSAGGASDDVGNGIAVDAATNVFVTGYFGGTCAFGNTNLTGRGTNGTRDIFVAKYNAAGSLLWVLQAGGSGDDEGNAIAADPAGNAIFTGRFAGTADFGGVNLTGSGMDIFVAKSDPGGRLQWARRAGGNNLIYGDRGYGVAVNSLGEAFVSGYFSGTASFGSTNLVASAFEDVFVAKYDRAGSLLWAQKAGGTDLDVAYAIGVSGSGKISVAGFFSGTAAFGPTNLASYGGRDSFVAQWGVVERPRLVVARSNANLLLSWPAAATGFFLESADRLPAVTWTALPATQAVINATNFVVLPVSGPQRYYRLKQP